MNILFDLRHAVRLLRRNPISTCVIVLTLALCIGANTAIFSLVDSFLLRPLPYFDPSRLAQISTYVRGHGIESDETGQTGRAWEAVRDHATFLDSAVFSDGTTGLNLSAGGVVQYVQQQRVGAGFFRVLGITPLMGREFTSAEDRPGGPALAVLSYSLWKRLFHEDSAMLGKPTLLGGEPYTIIGVMPESFHFYSRVDLWTPLKPDPNGEGSGENYAIVARLQPGVTWRQADSQLETISRPPVLKPPPGVIAKLRLMTLQQGQTQDVREPLLIVWACVGFVLLIGCANVAGLLLARSASRRREIAARLALGAGRIDIILQCLTETLVLAALGGVAGLLVAYLVLAGLQSFATQSFQVFQTQYFQIFQPVRLDLRVLAATALLSILASVLAGVIPAFEAGNVDILTALSEGGARGVAGPRKRWSRRFLVVGEIALAVMLLIGAGLLLRSLVHLDQLRPGFDAAHVITASFSMQDARYDTPTRVNTFFASALDQMRALPGVEAAGVGLTLPYERALNMGVLRAEEARTGRTHPTNVFYATPGYLEALRIPLLRGRAIRETDSAASASIAVVNEAFATRYLAREDPVGSHIRLGNEVREVVGVIGNVQQAAGFGDFGPLGAVPAAYIPVTQVNSELLQMVHIWFTPSWVVRTAGSSPYMMRAMQNAVAAVDPLLPIAEFRTFNQVRSTTLSLQRFQAILFGSLSALAFLLAIVGIYGLMANSVVERTREFGIRMALGATVFEAIGEATRPALILASAGIAAGCFLAVLSARVLRHMIWGVTTTDPRTYLTVAVALLAVAAAASLVPALRITHLNPADTLRQE